MLTGRRVGIVDDGINQYAYVRNNPVNRIDPNGTVSVGTNNFGSLNNNYFGNSSLDLGSQSLFDFSPGSSIDSLGFLADSLKSPVAASLNNFNPFREFQATSPPSRTIDFSIPAGKGIQDTIPNVDGRLDVNISTPSRRPTEINGFIRQPVQDGNVREKIQIPDGKMLRKRRPIQQQLPDPGFNRDIDFRIRNKGPSPIDIEFIINPRPVVKDGNYLLS